MIDLRPEISDWAEHVAAELARGRLADDDVAGILHAATADEQLAYEVIVTLSRTVALVLRPDGHAGGVIGPLGNPARIRAAQLVGLAAQGDVDLVDAIARTALAAPDPLFEARETLWSILEVLALEPVLRPDPPEGSPA